MGISLVAPTIDHRRPVKCHLPLITTRIEFQFNVLSPHPQITLRRDLGAVIRRQARRATPYTRLNPRGVAVTAHRTAHRAESPLTDMDSDDSDGESEQIMQSHKILKPKGEAGKSNSGGYNLQDAMGWEDKEFTQQKYINVEVEKKLDNTICYSKQKPEDRII